jgi:IS4 transposase
MFAAVFDRFLERSPVSVMFRGLLEDAFAAEAVDAVFAERARRQCARELAFSTVVDVLALVVLKIHKSVNAVYAAKAVDVATSVNAVYDKLQGVEPTVCEGLLEAVAERLDDVLAQSPLTPQKLLPGYEVRIVDGNHLAGTQHRLKELRTRGAAALPGQALVVFDPQRQFVVDLVACPDGHVNECVLVEPILAKVAPRQVWIADRGFSTVKFLTGVARGGGFFVIRRHRRFIPGDPIGPRRSAGRIDGGRVYEQPLALPAEGGLVRLITLELKRSTRDGAEQIEVLSNLPPEVDASTIARLYAQRWQIETAFADVAVHLRSEIDTLGYPSAALLGFTLGLIAYNLLSTIRQAVAHAHRKQLKGRRISIYALADEVAGVYRGMEIAIDDRHWQKAFGGLSARDMAMLLMELAPRAQMGRFLAAPVCAKKPPPKRTSGARGKHVSTYRLLQERRLNN